MERRGWSSGQECSAWQRHGPGGARNGRSGTQSNGLESGGLAGLGRERRGRIGKKRRGHERTAEASRGKAAQDRRGTDWSVRDGMEMAAMADRGKDCIGTARPGAQRQERTCVDRMCRGEEWMGTHWSGEAGEETLGAESRDEQGLGPDSRGWIGPARRFVEMTGADWRVRKGQELCGMDRRVRQWKRTAGKASSSTEFNAKERKARNESQDL
jgi:hypothetical protein